MNSRRSARLRREYLNVKRVEDLQNELNKQKKVIKEAHDTETALPTHLKKLEQEIRDKIELEDINSLNFSTPGVDSEYRLAGIRNPKIIITTGRHVANPTINFAKELSHILPNSHRFNRGGMGVNELMKVAVQNDITDIIIVGGSAKKGYPTSLTLSHLPHGPTAIFELKDVVLRHDLEKKAPPMPTHHPNLVFEGFSSKIGQRFMHILKYIFPPTEGDLTSRGQDRTRVVSFINKKDEIHFRHHLYDKIQKLSEDELNDMSAARAKGPAKEWTSMKFLKLYELGPRFSMKPYRIVRGLFNMEDCENEWTNPTFINRPKAILSETT